MDNIWVASSDGNLDHVKQKIEQEGTEVDAQDENGYTPLQASISYSHRPLFDYLISHGADPLLADMTGSNIVHYCDDPEMFRYVFVESPHSIARHYLETLVMMRSSDDQLLPIEYHLQDGNLEMVQVLREFMPAEYLRSEAFVHALEEAQLEQQISSEIFQSLTQGIAAQAQKQQQENHDDEALR